MHFQPAFFTLLSLTLVSLTTALPQPTNPNIVCLQSSTVGAGPHAEQFLCAVGLERACSPGNWVGAEIPKECQVEKVKAKMMKKRGGPKVCYRPHSTSTTSTTEVVEPTTTTTTTPTLPAPEEPTPTPDLEPEEPTPTPEEPTPTPEEPTPTPEEPTPTPEEPTPTPEEPTPTPEEPTPTPEEPTPTPEEPTPTPEEPTPTPTEEPTPTPEEPTPTPTPESVCAAASQPCSLFRPDLCCNFICFNHPIQPYCG